MDDKTLASAVDLLKALAHPIRLKIVYGLLQKNECNVGRMVKGLGLPQSTVSQHLALLKSLGVVTDRREGLKVCYRVLDKRVEGIVQVLRDRG